MLSFKTIREGDKAIVWSANGQGVRVEGPKWLWLWNKTVELLPRVAADPQQYLVVKFKNGKQQHVRGPTVLWLDPVLHESIQVEPCLALDSHEAIVVYRHEDGAVQRRVVRGPSLFMPQADEWLHEFRWHGADPKDHTRKIPRALKFTKLRVIPDQMYFDVLDVRTADDALLTVKLMVFFELTDIERMLDQTHDPVADFINALSADIIDFAATLSFEQFKEQTERLNRQETYQQLAARAQRIGYRINKVVYRGYHASATLQAMHDGAIEARTQLKLEAETERQEQELADLKLAREQQRAVQRQRLEQDELAHQNLLSQLKQVEQLRRKQAAFEAKLAGEQREQALNLEHQQALNREQLVLLGGMKEMQIDLTRYLVAQQQHPERLIQIDTQREPRLHVHDN